MFLCEQPFTEVIPRIVPFKHPLVTGIVLNHAQIWFVVTVLLATLKIKKTVTGHNHHVSLATLV
jgi:hypothetical protein